MEIFENINTEHYRVAPISVGDNTDTSIAMNTVTHKGGIITYFDDDMFIATCISKKALEDITDYLDETYEIDEYSINVYENTGTGAVSKLDGDVVDIDSISNFNNLNVEIVVFFVNDNISYDDYIDVESDDLTERFVNTNKKQPVWLALDSTSLVEGTFIATPHPIAHNKLLVHAEYHYSNDSFLDESALKIVDDINTINNGSVYAKLTAAGYVLDESIGYDFSVDNNADGHFCTPPAIFVKSNNVNLPDIMESFGDTTLFAETGIINEVKRVLKVNFKGKKRIKMKCLPGYKYDVTRRSCVKISGSEKAVDRKAKLKMARTKKSKGSGLKLATARKTKKAKRFRKLMGK